MIIVIMMFVDRSTELKTLEERWKEDRFNLIMIYGRRRVGKTELIKKFSQGKPHIYFLVPEDTEEMQRDKMLEITSNHFKERKPEIDNWRETFTYLKEKLNEEKLIFSIDEFPYLVKSNKAVLSYIQELADETESNSTLILCGSSISVMESEVMGHKSPLYGRRTGQINLKPFNFSTSFKAIDYPLENAIRSYSITGGTPMYLLNFNYEETLEENIHKKILQKTSFMHEEPEFLLRTELRNPSRYIGILEAIANGHTKPNRIAGATGIGPGPLSNYLKTLRRLRLVKREVPVTAEQKKSKRSIYRINDNFFRFWFHFIEPKKSGIEENPREILSEHIFPSLNEFTSNTFEEICQEAIWESNRKENSSSTFPKVGKWWYRDNEIDIVALNKKDKEILFGECKWSENKVGKEVLRNLEDAAEKVRWKQKDRREKYTLFSKSGFTKPLKDLTQGRKDIELYDLKKLEKTFT